MSKRQSLKAFLPAIVTSLSVSAVQPVAPLWITIIIHILTLLNNNNLQQCVPSMHPNQKIIFI